MNKTIPAFELFNEIGIINQLATTMFERVLPKGMTQAQFTVLNHFVRLGHQERSPAQLAFAFQVTRPTMTSTLSRMERAGLILVRADPRDGRGKLVSLTEKGHAMRETCLAAASTLFPILDGLISRNEFDAMMTPLTRLRKALDEMRNVKAADLN
ncbi:MAG: MarR family transcriptional regulator [Sphingomonadaceae bacterium]|jgi:DNA-binding MarR family transcriptional regulator